MSESVEALILLKNELTQKIRSADPEEKKALIQKCKEITNKIKRLNPPKIPSNENNANRATRVTDTTRTFKKSAKLYSCVECNNDYAVSDKMRVPIIYCKSCRKVRGKDIMELIDANGNIIIYQNSKEAEKQLGTLKADHRLDLHKTLDTVSPNTKLPNESSCCISYVGCLTTTRLEARKDITDRITKGQIKFGCLVFKRGPSKEPEKANTFMDVGSKAWFNKFLPGETDNVLFVDDSTDHVNSVRHTGIRSVCIKPNESLLQILSKTK